MQPFTRIKLNFRTQIYLVMFSLLLLLGLVTFFIVSRIMHDAMIEENENRAVSIGVNLSARLVEPVLTMDYFSMKKLVDETVRLSDDIYYTFVLNADQTPVVHSFQNGFPVQLIAVNPVDRNRTFQQQYLDTGQHLVYDYALPIVVDSTRIGTLRLGLLKTKVDKTVNRIMVTALSLTLFSIMVAAFAGFFLFRPMTRDINQLHQAAEQVMRGNLDVRSAPLLRKNCWDIMKCNQTDCPAYHNTSQRCWYLAGTLCKTCAAGDYAKKIDSCRHCRVYKLCAGNEIQSLAENFDYMILSLKDHLEELKQAQKEISNQKNLLQTILDGVPDIVSFKNRKGEYISVNQAFCTAIDKTRDHILGKKVKDLFPEPLGGICFEEDLNVLKTGQPLVSERPRMDGGTEKWLHIVKSPVFREDGQIRGIVTSCRDISEYKIIQEQLFHAQKMESVGELAAGVAHEINTPLGIILGYSQILQQEAEPDTQMLEDLKLIEKHTRICSRIVSDLLRFSRRVQSTITEFDIHAAIDDVLQMTAHTFGLEHVTIQKAYDGHMPALKGDKEKIKQVFINLLNNAFDAIGQNGDIGIKTCFDRESRCSVVTVSDTGSGIPQENMKKLFDPFFTTKGVGKGTGLGLAVTFGIIKEHNGTIKVKSKTDTNEKTWPYGEYNTVFIVSLPAPKNNETA